MDEKKLESIKSINKCGTLNHIADGEEKIALNILQCLQESEITVIRAIKVLDFCKEAIQFISRVGH